MKNAPIILLVLFLAWTAQAEPKLKVEFPYVRAMPPGQTVTAAFMTIKNSTNQRCSVIGGRSAKAAKLELHEHTHVEGMMRMRPVDTVNIPAGESIIFKPGGLHIMLFGVESSLQPGEQVPLVLNTDVCGEISVGAEVRSLLKSHKGRHH